MDDQVSPKKEATKSLSSLLKNPRVRYVLVALAVILLLGLSYWLGRRNAPAETSNNTKSEAQVAQTEPSVRGFDPQKDALVADFVNGQTFGGSNSSLVDSISYNIFIPKELNFDAEKDHVQMSYINDGVNELLAVDTKDDNNQQCKPAGDGLKCALNWDLKGVALSEGVTVIKFAILDDTADEKGRVFVPISDTLKILNLGFITIKKPLTDPTAETQKSEEKPTEQSGPVTVNKGTPASLWGYTLNITNAHVENAEYVNGSKYYPGEVVIDDRSYLVIDFTIKNETGYDTSYDYSWTFSYKTPDGKILNSRSVLATSGWSSVGYANGSTATGQQAFVIESGQENGGQVIFKSPRWLTDEDTIFVNL